jgi:transcriptional regulator with XRE-family HTH domain
MKFIHMHENLRLHLLRKIQHGSISVTSLARKTGLAQSHISNFLRKKRGFSVRSLDLVLEARHIEVEDLLPSSERHGQSIIEDTDSVPLVSHESALFEPSIRPSAILAHLPLPTERLNRLLARSTADRHRWQRFVAVRVSAEDAEGMAPAIAPEAFVVIDRHYNSLRQYDPERPTLYAIRCGAKLLLRYADFLSDRLVLRPENHRSPVELLEIDPGTRPQDLIVGRVVLAQNPM